MAPPVIFGCDSFHQLPHYVSELLLVALILSVYCFLVRGFVQNISKLIDVGDLLTTVGDTPVINIRMSPTRFFSIQSKYFHENLLKGNKGEEEGLVKHW